MMNDLRPKRLSDGSPPHIERPIPIVNRTTYINHAETCEREYPDLDNYHYYFREGGLK